MEALDLRGVAQEVVGDLRLTAASRAITLKTIQSASPVMVLGDRTQLFRALTNLVSNAVKFSEPTDVVEVRVAPVGRQALLEVVDEGIGIPASDLDGLGSRFFRASNATRSEIAGTGLGLRIVQTIVDRHSGTLGIESVEDAGTTVTVRLPLSQPAPSEEVTRAPAWADGRPPATGLIRLVALLFGRLDPWLRFTSGSTRADDPAATTRGHHAEGHPPQLHRHRGALHLWQHVHHPQHRLGRQHPRRRVLGVPPVLHGQAEDPRHRWPRGPVPGSLRQGKADSK